MVDYSPARHGRLVRLEVATEDATCVCILWTKGTPLTLMQKGAGLCFRDELMKLEEELYAMYPRKVGKRKALAAISRSIIRLKGEVAGLGIPPMTRFDWIKERVRKFASSPKGNAGEFTPHPATWFNQSRYLDDEREWFREERNGNGHDRNEQRLQQALRSREEGRTILRQREQANQQE
jgi:hypothetical protein